MKWLPWVNWPWKIAPSVWGKASQGILIAKLRHPKASRVLFHAFGHHFVAGKAAALSRLVMRPAKSAGSVLVKALPFSRPCRRLRQWSIES
jgi:hypothetical protein